MSFHAARCWAGLGWAGLGWAGLGWAGLQFDAPVKEIAPPITDDTEIQADFPFANTGTQPVTIAKFNCACSGLTTDLDGNKLVYQPGEKGVLRTRFRPGIFTGNFSKGIALWLAGDPEENPSHTLILKISLPELLAIDPPQYTWLEGAPAETRTFTLTVQNDQTVNIRSVALSSENFRHALRTIEPGRRYRVDITPVNTSIPGIAVVKIETDSPLPRHQTKAAFVAVRKK